MYIHMNIGLAVVLSFLSSTLLASSELERQQAALTVIADFSDRICNKIPLSGNTDNLELSGEAKAELKGLLKKVADIGIEGAAKYQKSDYENVLQKDLASLVNESSKCKQEVWKDLKDKLLVSAAPTPAKKVRKNFDRKFEFEDHHCSVNEERSSSLCVDSGFSFTGMVGQPSYSSKDNCGSQFVSFNADPNNKQCGIFKVKLVGCGHDWLKTCKGHAWIKGTVKLSGISE